MLGRGGMGVVYKARRIGLNRPCALKMILAGAHAGPEAVGRFVAEAEAIAQLQHPNIVQIHHIGETGGLPFFELEYLAGGSLDRRLDGVPWLPKQAAWLAEQLARGMSEAHRLSILHRDLKPSNVLLASDGTPKITDFGLAKAEGRESSLTRSDSILGSPSYMAPEQASGKTKQAGPAVDTYAIGATLYELLTGRPPFRGTTPLETMEQVRTIEPVPPSRLVPKLPRDIETICLKCLQKEPAKRYESALLLAEDLRRFQAGEPVVARRVGGLERAWRWCRRNPALATLAGAVAAALVCGTIVSAYFAVRAHRGEALPLEGSRIGGQRAASHSRDRPRQRASTPRQRFEALERAPALHCRDEPRGSARGRTAIPSWWPNTSIVTGKGSRARPISAASSGTTSSGWATWTSARCAGTLTSSWEWPSIPTAAGWSRRATTARSRSGTRRPAGRSARWFRVRGTSSARRFLPTAGTSSPAASTTT